MRFCLKAALRARSQIRIGKGDLRVAIAAIDSKYD